MVGRLPIGQHRGSRRAPGPIRGPPLRGVSQRDRVFPYLGGRADLAGTADAGGTCGMQAAACTTRSCDEGRLPRASEVARAALTDEGRPRASSPATPLRPAAARRSEAGGITEPGEACTRGHHARADGMPPVRARVTSPPPACPTSDATTSASGRQGACPRHAAAESRGARAGARAGIVAPCACVARGVALPSRPRIERA